MKKLTLSLSTAVAFGFGLLALQAQAQTSTTPPGRTTPSFVTNPYANPIISYQQRQRDLAEQRATQKTINDLTKLELLKARRESQTKDPKTSISTSTDGQPPPKTSTSFSPTKTTTTTGTTAGKPKTTEKMLPADATETTRPDTTKDDGKPKLSKTYSNYQKLIRK